MHVFQNNDVKVYEISTDKKFPYWLNEKKRRQLLRSDEEFQHRIELLQDFDMPVASSNVSVTPDCNYIISSGIYKPRIRCHDVHELSLKFERCMDSEVIKFSILSEDYSKIVLLQNDRYVEFHSQDSVYYRLRIPSFGRDLAYDYYTCDLNISSKGPNIYRLNLELGQFLHPYYLDDDDGLSMCINYDYHFLCAGTEKGYLVCFDPRVRERVSSIKLQNTSEALRTSQQNGVTALSFKDGITLGVGLENGVVALYDIRSSRALLTKDHNYGEKIKRINFVKTNNDSDYVTSCDSHSLKIWEVHTAKMFTTVEPDNPINDFTFFPNSGLIFFANESPKSSIYFIPSFGSAPKWCNFLDNITEELEETSSSQIFDDYKFVTRHELETLGLSNLIGTDVMRAYMHGFFIDIKLYKKAKAATEPLSYEDYKKKAVRKKIEAERIERIKLIKLPSVNKALAEHLLKQKPILNNSDLQNPVGDDRFKKMFEDSNFEIDPSNEHYKLLQSVGVLKKSRLPPQLPSDIIPDIPTLENPTSDDDLGSSHSDVLEDIDEEEESIDETKIKSQIPATNFKITAISNNSDIFTSLKPNNQTLEEKFNDNLPKYDFNKKQDSFGDKELEFMPSDNKAMKKEKNIHKLKTHLKEKKTRIRNVKSILTPQARKIVASGFNSVQNKKR